MKLYSLLKNIKCRVFGSELVDISGLYHNDKEVKNGGLFFCINGKNFNGEDFVKNAVDNGAVAVVLENEEKGLRGITQVLVKNVRRAMSLIACNFYGNPSKNLKMIGVTGTNGKTTTTHMISGLIEAYGKKCAIIGTNGVVVGKQVFDIEMTTPDPIELQRILRDLFQKDIEYVCMEVSAHACYLNKLDGIHFELMIFTNLTEDHLDYFETMENYYLAKQKIFNLYHTKQALINIDDDYGLRLAGCIKIPFFTYSIHRKSNFMATEIKFENLKQMFYFNNLKFSSKFLGEFNVYNLLSSISCLKILNFWDETISEKVANLKQVAGRFNTIIINGKLFVIDYAHTPDGLENVLKLSNSIKGNGKLYCIFGCGGNRETQKRAKMGEISSKYADFTVITSDNPRFESREKIANDIKNGLVNNNYKIILDRAEAIKFANEIAVAGDVILIAGKGAENYIDENGEKKFYSDFDEVEKLESL